ncbi:DUF3887 domain-containing protein [Pannus brasiliensis CCIBt3594]|uniref:DUF3887 domain-containing protein n=1 Tax=Pannus brasiliensis CCIBt3594 TaxID=1427578 RepID=A0AAW9QXD8_9CHRO
MNNERNDPVTSLQLIRLRSNKLMTIRLFPARRVAILSLCALGLPVSLGFPTIAPVKAHNHFPLHAQANPASLEARAKEIVGWLGAKDFAKARSALAPQLQPLWSAEKIQQNWESQVIDYTGPVKKIGKAKTIDAVNAKLVIVTVEFEKYTGDVILTFNNSDQVIAADFPEFRDIDRLGRDFIESMAKKDYATARGLLSPLLKTEVFPTRVQTGWESLLKKTGPFERIVGTQVRKGSDTDGVDLVLVTIQFENRTDTAILVFDDRKGIVNVDFPLND